MPVGPVRTQPAGAPSVQQPGTTSVWGSAGGDTDADAVGTRGVAPPSGAVEVPNEDEPVGDRRIALGASEATGPVGGRSIIATAATIATMTITPVKANATNRWGCLKVFSSRGWTGRMIRDSPAHDHIHRERFCIGVFCTNAQWRTARKRVVPS